MQVWERTVDGRRHRVESEGSVRRRLRWYVDDVLVVEKTAYEDSVELDSGKDHPDLGAVKVKFSVGGAPRRASLHGDLAGAIIGAGGTDLVPEAGSPAAAHEQKLLAHPHRYVATRVGIAVALIGVPLLIGLLSRFLPDVDIPFPDIPWPDIPWPDIPWPDLPSIPLPDLPDWIGLVWPVLLALVLARAEIRRRRRLEEERRDRD